MAIDFDGMKPIPTTASHDQRSVSYNKDQGLGGTLVPTNSKVAEETVTGVIEEPPCSDHSYPSTRKTSIIIAALCLATLLDAIDITV